MEQEYTELDQGWTLVSVWENMRRCSKQKSMPLWFAYEKNLRRGYSNQHVYIFSDSQAALKTQVSTEIKSGVVMSHGIARTGKKEQD